jgi:hypothetical protein
MNASPGPIDQAPTPLIPLSLKVQARHHLLSSTSVISTFQHEWQIDAILGNWRAPALQAAHLTASREGMGKPPLSV